MSATSIPSPRLADAATGVEKPTAPSAPSAPSHGAALGLVGSGAGDDDDATGDGDSVCDGDSVRDGAGDGDAV
jgi:hypothetical protein